MPQRIFDQPAVGHLVGCFFYIRRVDQRVIRPNHYKGRAFNPLCVGNGPIGGESQKNPGRAAVLPLRVLGNEGQIACVGLRCVHDGKFLRFTDDLDVVGGSKGEDAAEVTDSVRQRPDQMFGPSFRLVEIALTNGTWAIMADIFGSPAAVTMTWPPLKELPHSAIRSGLISSSDRTCRIAACQSCKCRFGSTRFLGEPSLSPKHR